MGNGQHRYLSNSEAVAFMGHSKYLNIYDRLLRPGCKHIDFEFFHQVLRSRFPSIPSSIAKLLFRGFAADVGTNVDIDVFLSSLAAFFSLNNELQLKFLARVYDSGVNTIERAKLEEVFALIHGDMYEDQEPDLRGHMDALFPRSHREISHRAFELYKGDIKWLAGWAQKVLSVWLESLPSLPPSLCPRHYSERALALLPMLQSRSKALLQEGENGWQLTAASSQGAGVSLRDVSPCWSQMRWLRLASRLFISAPLALILFGGRGSRHRAVWGEEDFAAFAIDFAGVGVEDEQGVQVRIVALLVDAFVEFLERQRDLCQVGASVEGQSATDGQQDKVISESEVEVFLTVLSLRHDFAPPGTELTTEADEDSLLLPLPLLPELSPDLKGHWSAHRARALHSKIIVQLRDFVLMEASLLPGLKDVRLAAWALGGLRPPSPVQEKEAVVEMTLRYLAVASSAASSALPRDAEEAYSNQSFAYGPRGTAWSLLPKAFHEAWCRHVGSSHGNGGLSSHASAHSAVLSLDLSCLFVGSAGSHELADGLEVGRDVEVTPPPVFFALQGWYGGAGGTSGLGGVVRRVNTVGEVELYPLVICLWDSDDWGRPTNCWATRELSPSERIGELVDHIAREKSCAASNLRLWLLGSSTHGNGAGSPEKGPQILSCNDTWAQHGIPSTARVLVEMRKRLDAPWPRGDEVGYAAQTSLPNPENKGRGPKIGLVGLDNVGNTCYLNACLQVLLHTPPLRDYLLSPMYAKHIHRGAPTSGVHSPGAGGSEGRLADSLGKLAMQYLSTPPFRSISPKDFHSSRDQHDAQELLAFLLDGLGEDLNLNKVVAAADSSDAKQTEGTDESVSDGQGEKAAPSSSDAFKSRQAHLSLLARERSVVAALFTGQCRCTLQCSRCEYVSSQFEPFNTLSLPLPETTTDDGEGRFVLCVVRRDFRSSVRLRLKGNACSDVTGLIAAAGDELSVKASPWVCESTGASESNAQAADTPGADSMLFVAAELHAATLKVRAFLPPDRTVVAGASTSGALLCLFEVDSGVTQGLPSNTEGVVDVADTISPSVSVRVVFTMRRARIATGRSLGLGGYDTFSPESFSMPFIETLPSRLSCSHLYHLVESRIGLLYKSPLGSLQRYMERHSSVESKQSSKCADDLDSVMSLSNIEVFAGNLPSRGFTLRLVTSSAVGPSGYVCSRCPWLSRCAGCTIPDRGVPLTLLDGESLAVDFHHAVSEELLPSIVSSLPPFHDSSLDILSSLMLPAVSTTIPLTACLEKFSERELLPDFTCPRCKERAGKTSQYCEYGQVSRSITISYLPPILVLHLKRFQWLQSLGSGVQGSGRWRKLSPRITFPLQALDLTPFMLERDKHSDFHANCSVYVPQLYDLYAVIHHMGALGGGHYVATIKVNSGETTEGNSTELPTLSNPTSIGGRFHFEKFESPGGWFIFNDNMVTPIPEPPDTEVTASSAYLLFYLRRGTTAPGEDTVLNYISNVLRFSEDPIIAADIGSTIGDDKKTVEFGNHDISSSKRVSSIVRAPRDGNHGNGEKEDMYEDTALTAWRDDKFSSEVTQIAESCRHFVKLASIDAMAHSPPTGEN
eukprot:gene27274-32945_t